MDLYRPEEAETLIVALGSVNGTIKDAVDELRDEGLAVGSIKLTSYRPFPSRALKQAVGQAKRVIVLEKDLSVGKGGIVSANVKMALQEIPTMVMTVIGGLGGRAIPQQSIVQMIRQACEEGLEEPHFLDLNWDVVNKEFVRQQAQRRSGSVPEHILREVGPFGVKIK